MGHLATEFTPGGQGVLRIRSTREPVCLLLVMAVPAVLILPKRLKAPDFLAQRHNVVANQTTGSSRLGADRHVQRDSTVK